MRAFIGRPSVVGKMRNIYCSANVRSNKTPSQPLPRKRPWREAASLIIAAPSEITGKIFPADYAVLNLKRASKSSFFPNAYVYPGGALDDADRNPKWLDILTKFDGSFKDSVIHALFFNAPDEFHSDLFRSDKTTLEKGLVPNEIAFRICAIREAFEESGLLLLTDDLEARMESPSDIHCKCVSYLLPKQEAKKWRQRVHDNADEFINLCLYLNMVPDIWSLKEWSQWLTPTVQAISKNRKNHRYDTVFYCCCLKKMPSSVSFDNVETTESIWQRPWDMIQMYLDKNGYVGPPQIIESLRMLNFVSLDGLTKYICGRAPLGLERWTPYIAMTKDSVIVHMLPGDDAYPADYDVTRVPDAIPVIDHTYRELQSMPSRFGFKFNSDPAKLLSSFTCTAKLKHGQISAVPAESMFNISAKL